GAAATLRWFPGYGLIRILDITCFAVDAVLGVDHEARRTPLLHPFVDPGRAITGRGPPINVELGRLLAGEIGDLEVYRLIFLVIGVGEEHRREPVEGELAVGLGIGNRRARRRRLQRGPIRLAVAKRTEQREPERVAPHVEAAQPDPEVGAELRP